MKWSKDSRAHGECGEYLISEHSSTEFTLFCRDKGEKAYSPLGTFTSLEKAKAAAERSH